MGEDQFRFEHKHSKALAAKRNVSGLMLALDHPDVKRSSLLRHRVVRELGDQADTRAIPALSQVLVSDSSPGNRVQAAIALGRIEHSDATEVLRQALKDSNRRVRLVGINNLGHLRDRESVNDLILLLQEGDKWEREYAARALGNIGDQRATLALVEGLDDPVAGVRRAAAAALAELGDSTALKPLRQAYAAAGFLDRRNLRGPLRELEERFGS